MTKDYQDKITAIESLMKEIVTSENWLLTDVEAEDTALSVDDLEVRELIQDLLQHWSVCAARCEKLLSEKGTLH